MSRTRVEQFTEKQMAIANRLAEGYSYREIEEEGIACIQYIAKCRTNPKFNNYLYSLMQEWQKVAKNELLLIAKQKIKELVVKKPKKDLLDYIDYVTKLTGQYAPSEVKLDMSTESDLDSRFKKLMAEIESQPEIRGLESIRGTQETIREG